MAAQPLRCRTNRAPGAARAPVREEPLSARITILHATDLHLRRSLPGSSGHAVRRSREVPELLERLADVVAARRPDLLVLTGDLVDVPHPLLHGDPAQHPETMAEAVADYRLLRRWLDALPCRWHVIPGNHDRADAFATVFGIDRPAEMRVNGVRVVGFEDWEVADNRAERRGASRDRFLALLDDGDPAPQVHLQHYLIRPDVAYRYPLMYREAADLAAAIERSGRVRAVLSGHWHQGEPALTVAGTTYSVCPTFCEWPHRYRMVTIDGDGTRVETAAIGTAADRRPRAAAFVALDRLIASPEAPEVLGTGIPLLRRAADAGRLPVVVVAWQPDRLGWRAVQTLADAVARSVRAAALELDAAYFVVAGDLDPAVHARLPAEGAPTADDLFPKAERELGLDLSGSTLTGGGDALAAAASRHGLAIHPSE